MITYYPANVSACLALSCVEKYQYNDNDFRNSTFRPARADEMGQAATMPRHIPDPAAMPRPPVRLQDRINRLFEAHHPPDALHREYRNREVVDACRRAGLEISESHLSELRRGIKVKTTQRILESIAWFFDVRVSYLVDHDVAEQEAELSARAAQLEAKLATEQRDREELAEAARELRKAISASGVTNVAHRATTKGMSHRESAAMMKALTRIIIDDDDEDAEFS